MDSALPQLTATELFPANSPAGALLAAIDWARTPLGPPSAWPPHLRTAVAIGLNGAVPAFLVWGPEQILIYNPAFASLLAGSHPGALGKPAAQALPAAWATMGPMLAAVWETAQPRTAETRLRLNPNLQAAARAYSVSCSPVFDHSGAVDGVFATAQESANTALPAELRQALWAAKEELHYTFELDFRIRWIADAQGNILDLSQNWLEMTGLSRAEGLGKGWRAVQHPDDLDRVAAAWQHALRSGEPLDIEHRMRTAGGAYRWMRLRALPRRDPAGNIVKWYGTQEDVDDRKRAELRLQESERRMRVAQEAAGVLIWEWCTADGKIVWGPGVERIYGRPPSELGFENWVTFLHPEDREPIRQVLEAVIRELRSYEAEYRIIWPDGSVRWLFAKGETFRNANGQVYLIGANLDITARKQAEEAIRQHGEQLREVLERTTDAVFLLDSEWRFQYLNGNAEQLIAAGRDLVGKNLWAEFPDAVNRNFYTAYHRARTQGVAVQFEEYYPQPLDKWFEVHAYPTADGLAVFFRDITLKRRSDAALLQSEKLAAAGRLAASIAHEINNPLEGVTNLLFLLEGNPSLDAPARRFVSMAQSELSRVSKIANQTLRFHRQSTRASHVNLEELLESAVALHFLRRPNSEIIFQRQYRPAPALLAFEGELRQVFANLVSNAADALGAGGHVVLRIRAGRNWKTGAPGIWIVIADNGHGMSAEVSRRLFEPFFSTKGMGGTGLGLWVSREIVEKHGGTLQIRSLPSGPRRGTSCAVFLPLAGAPNESAPAAG